MDKAADLDFLETLRLARDRESMLSSLGNRLKTFGIGGFGYGYFTMRTSRGLEEDLHDLRFHHTYPDAWETISDTGDPLGEDPATALLFAGEREVDWCAAGRAAPGLGPGAQKIHAAELDLGMRFGVTLRGAEDAKGRILSGFCLWFSDRCSEAVYRADWAGYGQEIRRTMHLFDTVARGESAATMVGLTRRECDALAFLAAGDRSAVASWKMGISEKTFEKHVASAKVKLTASTRDHAIAKALAMGLIEP